MTARFIVADVFDGLATLEDGSVDLVVTSPPFLALRSYLPADHPDKDKEIGSEATPAEFLDVMLRFTAELRRVVAPHGSICIELGDTYAGSGGAGGDYGPLGWRDGQETFNGSGKLASYADQRGNPDGMRDPTFSGANTLTGSGRGWPLAKSKTLIPELYRIALAYGINPLTGTPSPAGQWRIRNVVTWARPNPPVGALGDKWRPATSDVVVACLSGKRYWDDLATRKALTNRADRELAEGRVTSGSTVTGPDASVMSSGQGNGMQNASGAPLLDYWEIPLLEGEEPTKYGPKAPKPKDGTPNNQKYQDDGEDYRAESIRFGGRVDHNEAGAPLLDYWVIPPGGYEGSHYAVFPPELVVPLVKAMCPEKVCRTCGEPSRRIVVDVPQTEGNGKHTSIPGKTTPKTIRTTSQSLDGGWTDCGHDTWRPGLVLDPFAGSGTTLLVATGHGHDAIGIDLDSRNAELALQRVGPFLMEVV